MKLQDILVKIVQIVVVPVIAPIYIVREILAIRKANLAGAKALEEQTERLKGLQ